MRHARTLLLGLTAALAACETTTEVIDLAGGGDAIVSRAEPVRAWALVESGQRVGLVVQFDDAAAGAGSMAHYYSVRNEWHQELGTIDAHGRAYRFIPHEREALWVATGTLVEGVRAILRAGADSSLEDVPLEELAVPRDSAAH